MDNKALLIGDIGGTNARFALAMADGRGYSREKVFNCADYETSELAIEAYLDSIDVERPDMICLAAAGPVVNGEVDVTNNHWQLRETNLRARFDGAGVRILNDFEAAALGLPVLAEEDSIPVGALAAPDLSTGNFTVGVIGPGTGLGAAGLVCRSGVTNPLISEAGHIGFAPETGLQAAVCEVLRQRFGRVSDERLVSGSGLENIFSALAAIRGETEARLGAAEIFDVADENELAGEAINLFFEVFGQVAGNFALAIGAYDGIYIGGGIARQHEDRLMGSAFRAGFENKGRHRHLMESTPVVLIRHLFPGLLGAAATVCLAN